MQKEIDEQEVKELIEEIKNSGMPVVSQAILIEIVKRFEGIVLEVDM